MLFIFVRGHQEKYLLVSGKIRVQNGSKYHQNILQTLSFKSNIKRILFLQVSVFSSFFLTADTLFV